MGPCIRMKPPLAVTNPLFSQLQIYHCPKPALMSFSVGTFKSRQFGADAPSNISLGFPAQPQALTVFLDKLMLCMHTLEVSWTGYSGVSKKKRRSVFLWSQKQRALLGCASLHMLKLNRQGWTFLFLVSKVLYLLEGDNVKLFRINVSIN